VVVDLADRINGLVVVIDHSRKNRPDGADLLAADILGPSQKWQAAEHVIMLEKAEGDRLTAFVEGKDGESGRCFLTVSGRGSKREKFVYAGTPDQMAKSQRETGDDNRMAALNAIRGAGETGASIEQIMEQLAGQSIRLTTRTIQRHLGVLIGLSQVRKAGSSTGTRYYAVTGARQAP